MQVLLGAILLTFIPSVIVKQGQTVVMQLSDKECSSRISVFNKNYQCTNDNKLVIGIDLNQAPEPYAVVQNDGVMSILHVTEVKRPVEYWTSRPGRAVPHKQREAEKAVIQEALSSGERKYFLAKLEFPTVYPIPDVSTGDGNFGTRRIYRNPKTKKIMGESQHRGVDLPTERRHMPVGAIGRGLVVLADKFSQEGNMVVVYHGSGVYSLSMHLHKMSVRSGNYVNAGDILGLSGQTGSAKGIHLHLMVKVNGATVDPLQFIELFKSSDVDN